MPWKEHPRFPCLHLVPSLGSFFYPAAPSLVENFALTLVSASRLVVRWWWRWSQCSLSIVVTPFAGWFPSLSWTLFLESLLLFQLMSFVGLWTQFVLDPRWRPTRHCFFPNSDCCVGGGMVPFGTCSLRELSGNRQGFGLGEGRI